MGQYPQILTCSTSLLLAVLCTCCSHSPQNSCVYTNHPILKKHSRLGACDQPATCFGSCSHACVRHPRSRGRVKTQVLDVPQGQSLRFPVSEQTLSERPIMVPRGPTAEPQEPTQENVILHPPTCKSLECAVTLHLGKSAPRQASEPSTMLGRRVFSWWVGSVGVVQMACSFGKAEQEVRLAGIF